MSFFNPFRKNNRPQGVKLSELNQESASGTSGTELWRCFGCAVRTARLCPL